MHSTPVPQRSGLGRHTANETEPVQDEEPHLQVMSPMASPFVRLAIYANRPKVVLKRPKMVLVVPTEGFV